jgi:predicted RND superfamily exporter protein
MSAGGSAAAERLGRLIMRHRVAATLLLLLLTVGAALGCLSRVGEGVPIDFTPQALFNEDEENAGALSLRQYWGKDDNEVMVLLRGPVFTDEGLETLIALHRAVAADPEAEEVMSLVSVGVPIRDEGGAVRVATLLSELPADARAMADLERRALAEPALAGALVAKDGGMATLRVSLPDALERAAEIKPAVLRLRAAAAGVPLPAGYRVSISGIPEIRTLIVDQLVSDQLFYLPADALIFAVVLALLFRGVIPGLLPLLTVGLATLWATGLLLGAGVTFNVLSILIPALVLVIGISDGIHLLARYREELAIDRDREAAMGRTLAHLTVACFLTSFTTAAGFGSLAVASSRALRDFGTQSALAVMVAYAAVILGLPTLLAWVSVDGALRGIERRGSTPLRGWLVALDAAVGRAPWRALGLAAAATAIAVAIGSKVTTDSHMMELFPDDHPAVETYQALIAHGNGVVPVFAHLEAQRPEALKEPEVLAAIDALEREMLARDEVRWAVSPASSMRSVHRALTGQERLPDDEALIAQELFVLELGGDGDPLAGLVDPDWRVARVLALASDAGGHTFNDLAAWIEGRGGELLGGLGVAVTAAGDGIVASAGVHRIIDDLVSSVGLALAIIGGTLLLLLRDLKLAVLAMIPNVITLAFTVATLGVMGENIQTGNVVSFAVALGLAVDDTIHFLVRFREEREGGAPLDQCLRATFLGAGPALVFTTVLLVAGLGLLATSSLSATSDFGALAVSTLVAALAADLVVLPALLRVGRAG